VRWALNDAFDFQHGVGRDIEGIDGLVYSIFAAMEWVNGKCIDIRGQ